MYQELRCFHREAVLNHRDVIVLTWSAWGLDSTRFAQSHRSEREGNSVDVIVSKDIVRVIEVL